VSAKGADISLLEQPDVFGQLIGGSVNGFVALQIG